MHVKGDEWKVTGSGNACNVREQRGKQVAEQTCTASSKGDCASNRVEEEEETEGIIEKPSERERQKVSLERSTIEMPKERERRRIIE